MLCRSDNRIFTFLVQHNMIRW